MAAIIILLPNIQTPSIHFGNHVRPLLVSNPQISCSNRSFKTKNTSQSWRISCSPPETSNEETPPPPSPSPFISTYNLCSILGGIGIVETSYLTYVKLSSSDAFCPAAGGSCSDILNSDYAVVFGLPLPLLGFAAYAMVALLGTQLQQKSIPFGVTEASGRVALSGITASMAAASSYFLFILNTRFSGSFCSYCYLSAFISLTLFFLTLKDFEPQNIGKILGFQLCIASLVVASLTASYGFPLPAASSANVVNLPYYASEITTRSSNFAVALAKHLSSIGAKMYGAFWCSHCLEQKEMFGREAWELVDYVECFPNGYKTGTKVEKVCADAKIEGFPTWIINNELVSGEMELSDIAGLSGFQYSESAASK